MPVPRDRVTVVIPTLNEGEAIGAVLDELLGLGFKRDRILVVDGYSTDNTVEEAERRGVRVVRQLGKGKAGAIKTAIELVDTPYMLVMDGDYTYDPKDIDRLLEHADRYDEVIGFRRDRRNIPLLHRFGNWVISSTLSLLLGRRLNDPCSGMYLLRTDVARDLEVTSRGFEVEVEIAAQTCSYGEVAEVPISYRKRRGRRKLKTWRSGLSILLTALKVALLYNPVFSFSALAALLALPGVAILLHQLYLRYMYGKWSIGWSWLGLLLLMIGLQGLTVAILSLLLKRLERRMMRLIKVGKYR